MRRGRWVASVVPAGFDLEKLHLAYEHPRYLGKADASNIQPIATARQLRERTALTVLRKGIRIEGKVLDVAGKPIAGASILLGSNLPVELGKGKVR